MKDLTYVVGAGFIAMIGLFMYIVVPYLKQRMGENKFAEMEKWVKIAVQAAEMIFKESGMGAEKKKWVIEFLQSKGFTIDLDELDKMIESAVLEMKQADNK